MKIFATFLQVATVAIVAAVSLAHAQELCGPREYQRTIQCSIEYTCAGYTFTCPVEITYCCIWDASRGTNIARIEQIVVYEQTCFIHLYGCGALEVGGAFWNGVSKCVGEDLQNCWGDYPPCDSSTSITYEVWTAQCQRIENREVMPGDFADVIIPCSWQNRCYRKYQACYDFSTYPPTLVQRELERGVDGPPQCSTTVPPIPPPGKQWNEHWITPCFAPCSP